MNESKLRELIKKEKTPLYVFDMEILNKRVQFLKEHLPKKVKLCYAVKANSFIIDELNNIVDAFEICSPGEYGICEKMNIPHKKYVISGVNKEPDFINNIINKNSDMGCFTAESINQFELLHNSAKKLNIKLPVILRLTSGNQFGLDKNDLFDIIETYKNSSYIDIGGIQYFSGTQKTSVKKLRREIEYLDSIITEILEVLNFKIKKLEYGGGFPVSYFENEEFNESDYLADFSHLIENMTFNGEFVIELGRSIAASCGTYLTSVVDTKCNKNENYAIVDGGMHQIVYYGQSMAMKHPKIRLLSDNAQGENEYWNICGSLCTVNDFLVKHYPLPKLVCGDVLSFSNTGAYCVTEGISLFLTRELPAVILHSKNGQFVKVRNHIQTELFNAPNTI